jgi:hypothetical protein
VTGEEGRFGYAAAFVFVISSLIASGCSRSEAAKPMTLSEVSLMVSSPKPNASSRAMFEPEEGCLIGAYIDKDPALKSHRVVDGRSHADPLEFDAITGKRHAMYFFYLGYGRSLPKNWVAELKVRGKIVHIALEPNQGLDAVRDDEYLNQLAKDMAASGATIFLRYASEMNGAWVEYGGNPRKFIEKWRIVYNVVKRHAPNVVLVWCPYTTPSDNIDAYYPGDAYVDWVGVNMYNVTYFNQNPRTPARHVRPTDMLDQIYNTYSRRKPIMICEYGVTNFSALENRSVADYAVQSITELYTALRTRYPRVKCINYFNANALTIAHRRNNDYTVTSNPRVLQAYRKAISDPYFLSSLAEPDDLTPPAPLGSGMTLTLQSSLQLIDLPGAARIEFYVDERRVVDGAFDPDLRFQLRQLVTKLGSATLSARAYNGSGQLIGHGRWHVNIVDHAIQD